MAIQSIRRLSYCRSLKILAIQRKPYYSKNCETKNIQLSCYLNGKAELWTIDPSGAAFGYKGATAGKAKNNAKTEIEKLDLENLTVDQALKEAARIIHSVHDEVKDKGFDLELSWVCEKSPKHSRVPKEIAAAAEEAAKEALADSDSEDDM